jgi:hypothetical protein
MATKTVVLLERHLSGARFWPPQWWRSGSAISVEQGCGHHNGSALGAPSPWSMVVAITMVALWERHLSGARLWPP